MSVVLLFSRVAAVSGSGQSNYPPICRFQPMSCVAGISVGYGPLSDIKTSMSRSNARPVFQQTASGIGDCGWGWAASHKHRRCSKTKDHKRGRGY